MEDDELVMAKKAIGKLCKRHRKKKKWTYYYAAKVSGLRISQVQAVEEGKLSYTIDIFLKLAHALDIPLPE